MAYNPPLRGMAYKFFVAMTSQANPKTFLNAPSFASGEVQVSKDGGAFANITTLPAASGRLVEVNLSAAEMTADNIAVQFLDGSSEWCDLLVSIQTVDAGVPANVKQWNGTAVATPHSSGYPVVTIKDGSGVGEIDTNAGKVLLQDGAITPGVIAANAIDADALAADAGSELAAAVWASATRTLTATLDPSAATIATAVWNALRANHTAAGSFGEGVVANTVADKSGYSLSAAGVTAVQSGLSTLTAAQVNAEVDAALADAGLTPTVTGRIDQAISTRLAAAAYTAPANADIAAIKVQTDKLAFAGTGPYDIKATLDGESVTAATVSDKSGYSLSAAGVTAVQSGLSTLTAVQVNAEVDAALMDAGVTTTVMGRLDAAISTRLATAGYTVPANADIAAIKVQTDKLAFAGTGPFDIKATLDGETVTAATVNDKTGYALSAGGVAAVQAGLSTLTAAQVNTEVDAALANIGLTTAVTGRLDAAISTRLAAVAYSAAPATAAIAAAVWDKNLNDHNSPSTAGNKLNAASAAGDPWTASLDGYGAGSAGHLLATQLDAAISSRASHTAADAAAAVWSAATRSLANDGNIAAIKAKTDLIVANGATAVQLQPAAEAAVLAQLTNIAVEIHNTDLSQIAAPGNAAQALADAAVDPWTRGNLSAYAEGSAGKLVAARLDAAVSSRSSHSAVDASAAIWAAPNRSLANDATIAGIKARTDLIVANGATVADLTPAATAALQNARLHQLMAAAFTAPAVESLMARLLEQSGGSWRFTAASLAQTPATPPEIDEAAIATAVWQASMTGWLEGTMGYRITQDQAATDEIAAAVWATSLLPYNQSNSAGKLLRDSTAFPTAAQIATNVWEINPAAFAALNGTMGHRLNGLTPAAISNAVWSATQSVFQTPGTFGYLFDAPVSGRLGYADGSGSVAFTYILTSQSDNSPIAGVRVTASDDIAGSHMVAEAISNAAGVVIFHLDPGRYYLWREKPGWSFVDPDIQEVEG